MINELTYNQLNSSLYFSCIRLFHLIELLFTYLIALFDFYYTFKCAIKYKTRIRNNEMRHKICCEMFYLEIKL